MADDDAEELLEPGTAALDDVVGEAVGEDLAGQGGDGDAGALALEDVAEVLEVAVAAVDGALAQLEGGDVGPADDLVVSVHAARRAAVRARVPHLDLQEVLGRAVDLVERLLPRVRHRLHDRRALHGGGDGGGGDRRALARWGRRGGIIYRSICRRCCSGWARGGEGGGSGGDLGWRLGRDAASWVLVGRRRLV